MCRLLEVSRREISRNMKENVLVSHYTVAQYKVLNKGCNESSISNLIDREFDNRKDIEVAVSDLTYVRVGNTWELCMYYNRPG